MLKLWTEEERIILRAMWDKGDSSSVIAAALGRGRNSILGQANRLNFPRHVFKGKIEEPRKPKKVWVKSVEPPTIPQPTPVILPSSGVAFMDIGYGQCRAVIGRDNDSFKLVRFCGHPVQADKAWCPGHFAKFTTHPRWR